MTLYTFLTLKYLNWNIKRIHFKYFIYLFIYFYEWDLSHAELKQAYYGLIKLQSQHRETNPLQCQLRDIEKRCSIYRKEKGKKQWQLDMKERNGEMR